MTMTRREYLKQVAGVTAGVALPELLVGRNVAAMRGGGAEDITGKGSLKARAAGLGDVGGVCCECGAVPAGCGFQESAGQTVQHPGA